MKILTVDDEPDMLEELCETFKQQRYETENSFRRNHE